VLSVKEKLEQGPGPFTVRVDAMVALENITRFLSQKGVPFKVSLGDGESLIEVRG
jgi:hypothetical protein